MTFKNRILPPCAKCPYTLGLVHTLVSPCPQCKADGYSFYAKFQKYLPGNKTTDSSK